MRAGSELSARLGRALSFDDPSRRGAWNRGAGGRAVNHAPDPKDMKLELLRQGDKTAAELVLMMTGTDDDQVGS